jgi:hypothetical protein
MKVVQVKPVRGALSEYGRPHMTVTCLCEWYTTTIWPRTVLKGGLVRTKKNRLYVGIPGTESVRTGSRSYWRSRTLTSQTTQSALVDPSETFLQPSRMGPGKLTRGVAVLIDNARPSLAATVTALHEPIVRTSHTRVWPVNTWLPCVQASLQEFVSGQQFGSDVKTAVQRFQQQPWKFYAEGIHQLPCQWDACLNAYGDYHFPQKIRERVSFEQVTYILNCSQHHTFAVLPSISAATLRLEVASKIIKGKGMIENVFLR